MAGSSSVPDRNGDAPNIELAAIEELIAGSATQIWGVLTDFANPQVLAPTIIGATANGDGVGAVRIVKSSRGLEIHEQLLVCDPVTHLFRYCILDSGDMPFAHVTSYTCTVRLVPAGDRITQIHWRSEGTVDGPIEPIRDFLTTLYRNANRQIVGQIDK